MKEKSRINITKDEQDSILLINTKMETSQQALDFRALPNDVNFDHAAAFFAAALTARSEAIYLNGEWWRSIIPKYNLVGEHVHISENGEELIVYE